MLIIFGGIPCFVLFDLKILCVLLFKKKCNEQETVSVKMFQIFVSIEVLNKGIYSGLLKYKSSSLLCFNCAYICFFV